MRLCIALTGIVNHYKLKKEGYYHDYSRKINLSPHRR